MMIKSASAYFCRMDLAVFVFRATVAGGCGRAVGEFHHHIAIAGVAFHGFEGAAAHDEPCAELVERRLGRSEIFRITALVAHRDADNPVGFRHHGSPVLM
jgi:hypothetical protein